MSSLEFAGDSGSLSNINSTQGEFRDQIAALTDLMKQVAGNAAVASGNNASDPLSAPFTFFVNPYTGSDEFVGGSYNTYETGAGDELIESELKRLEKQRLTCGYSPQRPFKTINRAVIEAAIVTSKNWYSTGHPGFKEDSVSIVLSAGEHIVYNQAGDASVSDWTASKDPTTSDLAKFNPVNVGGLLLPRGVSLCGPDLRKTTIRPHSVPTPADELSDYSNRRAIFKVTGTGYFFGFTVKDQVGSTSSHHLLDAFQFASQQELDDFYEKINDAVGEDSASSNPASLSASQLAARDTEYKIVGPIDRTQTPSEAWDTTSSASPYIFNCSIRSNYGMSGAFMDGSKVEGLKSMVCANFTGVSLQKDMSSWQRYDGGNWTSTTYSQYINTNPDDIRMNPARLSRHISAINNAFIQEVSVFAIGQGIHHFTDAGGEITVTNSNSSFGACAALSKGYKDFAFPQDKDWNVGSIKVPLNVSEKTGNIRRIYLGTVSAINTANDEITLANPLATTADTEGSSTPAIMLADGYSFQNSKIWIENPVGNDWVASASLSTWSRDYPSLLNTGTFYEGGTTSVVPIGTNQETGQSLAVGKRVYIRRLIDTRTPSERRMSILLNNTTTARLPERNFVIQTNPNDNSIDRLFTTTGSEIFLVNSSGVGPAAGQGVAKTAEISLKRAAASVSYSNGSYYAAGTVVKYNNKHYQALRTHTTSTSSPQIADWGEIFVHMPSDYNTEDPSKNTEQIITFDIDSSTDPNSTTLGIDFASIWTTAGSVQDQYQNSTDYLGVHAFLAALGFGSSAAHAALVPQAEADRTRDVTSSADFPTAPSNGAANGLGNWAVEFRRPSTLRLYGHAWEWAGFLNYSKAIPAAQKELGPQNKFSYYFTNQLGGRVVPQGSNEDGFNITPRGLEDIETGATLSVDSIGASTIDDVQETDFPNGLTASSIDVDNLTINTSIDFPLNAAGTTDGFGVVRLADAAQLRSTGIVSGANDTERNNSINQSPDVVTIKGLNYWSRSAGVVTRREETLTIYVVPDNAAQGNSYTFNGVTVVLDENPNRTGSALSDITPEVKTRAVTLSRAAQYTNSILSEFEAATYVLANGPYYTSVTFEHIAHIYGSPSSFSTDSEIADYTTGATPNTNVKSLQDNLSVPCFATPVRVAVGANNQRITFQAVSTYMRFNKGGSVNGICWVGTERTLADTSNFPDSIYSANIQSYRSANSTSLANFLNAFLADLSETGYQLDKFYGWPCVYIKDDFAVKNTIFGAKNPGKGSVGYGRLGPSIFAEGDADLQLQGVYLLGTVRLEDGDLPALQTNSANVVIFNSGSEVYGERHSLCFIASRSSNARGVRLQITNPGTNRINPSGSNYERNLDSNCIHILDSNGNYGLMANRANTTGLRGATFREFIGQMATGSFIYSGGYSSTYGNFTVDGHHHGFAGVFGDDCGSSEKGNGPDSVSDVLSPLFLYRFNSYHDAFFQVADPPNSSNTSENTITYDSSNITLPVNPGTRVAAWPDSQSNSLNIYNYVYKRGIDVNTGNLVGGFGGTYFYL